MNTFKMLLTILLLISILVLLSCDEPLKKNPYQKPYTKYNSLDTFELNKTYMRTGFYFLSETEEGVKMLKEHSDEVYRISRKPFVSVDEIYRSSLEKENTEQGIFTSINMILDIRGTKNLAKGTGNPSQKYIAVVIGNRLLYVVRNEANIKTGVMSVILVGYSKAEIDEMINAINLKK